jgi:hypothetical protein
MARGKAYVINKYDFYRPRVMMAEAAALGYATNAIATPWQHEEDREVVLRYFRFLREHGDLYADARRIAEIGLVFPRRAIHAGDASPLEYTEAAGRTLIREHLLFDMIPDDLLTQTPLDGYRVLVIAAPEYLDKDEVAALSKFAEHGGKLIWTPASDEDRRRRDAVSPDAKHFVRAVKLPAVRVDNARLERGRLTRTILELAGERKPWSRATSPWQVEVHAYRQEGKKRTIVHLVNYNHKENAPGKSVSAREAPIEAEPAEVRLNVAAETKVRRVRFHSPDAGAAKEIPCRIDAGQIRITTPAFLVYGVCVIEEE